MMNDQNISKFISEIGKCVSLVTDVEIALLMDDKGLAREKLKLLVSKQWAVMEQVVEAHINPDHEIDFSGASE